MKRFVGFLSLAAAVTLSTALLGAHPTRARWSADERSLLASLTLSSLGDLPEDPSNRYADDTLAAQLGRKLFFDTQLSGNGKVSCGTCHLPQLDFQDGKPLAKGVGTTARRTMPIAGTAHSPWLFWDGRSDSQWSQALGPLESAVEHGGDRTQYAHYIAAKYRSEYEVLFGKLPRLTGLPAHAGPSSKVGRKAWLALSESRRDEITRVYANIGKTIAAFERTIDFREARFDRYVEAELSGVPHTGASSFTPDEEAGLRLFIGKAGCVNCHNGARLTDDHFHNTGVPVSTLVAQVDSGRTVGVRQALTGEFNCLSKYSDAKPEDCSELRFAVTEGKELVRAYKTPSLRNVAGRAPYMHAGQLESLTDVILHYDRAPRAPFGKSELARLHLSRKERSQIEAFLRTLSAPATITRASRIAPHHGK
jgi:cytochrome c peroxidase